MPHSNGKIYSEVVNGVKVGINTDDVVAVLGVGSHIVNYLCSNAHDKIKKWSRCKPVDLNTLYATAADMKNANYGLTVPVLSGTFESVVDRIVNKHASTEWVYTPPKGGVNSPYRLTDFENYYQDAQAPFPVPVKRGEIPFNVADDSITIGFDFPIDEADVAATGIESYNVQLHELTAQVYELGKFKLALAVRNDMSSSAGTMRFESPRTLENDGTTVAVTKSAFFTAGFTYTCYPFFYLQQTNGFIAVPSDGLSFKLRCYKSESGDLGGSDTKKPIVISLSYSNGVPTGTVTINNLTSKAVTLKEVVLEFYNGDDENSKTYWDYQGAGTTLVTVPANGKVTINVPANGSWRYGLKPQKDIENVTYVQLKAQNNAGGATVNSEIEEVW